MMRVQNVQNVKDEKTTNIWNERSNTFSDVIAIITISHKRFRVSSDATTEQKTDILVSEFQPSKLGPQLYTFLSRFSIWFWFDKKI
jgi:hypothetical protein